MSLADFDARRSQDFWQSIRSFVPAWDDASASCPEAMPFRPRFTAARPDIQELIPDATAPETSAQFAAAHLCAFWDGLPG